MGIPDQVHIVGAGHLGQHLAHAGPLGAEGHEQVLLVPVCQGHKGVCREYALLPQEVVVRAVPLDYESIRQLCREGDALLVVHLHDLRLDAPLFKLPHQVHSRAAAA